ncbi:MAG TPA: FAD-dependent thymidylate synthase [Methanosarcinales archaeon]|nr:FAD-dependent thymidylate synthase [Methanosarcinales archaeon]
MNIELIAITPNSEEVIENAGRTCYQSEAKEGYKVGTLIKALIKSGHDSVLEHAYCTFRINGCSRAMTHQLVRHRLMSISQQSQRYVKEDQFDYVIPPSVAELEKRVPKGDEDINGVEDFKNDMKIIQGMYDKWKGRGLKNEDARFVLPNACQSEIVISFNFREARHIFEVRCDKHAQWEIRAAANEMLKILSQEASNVFGDLAEKFLDSKQN